MNEQTKQKIRLIINGAISCYEGDCLDIPSVLINQRRTDLCKGYDTIGTALYWIKEEMEDKSPVSID